MEEGEESDQAGRQVIVRVAKVLEALAAQPAGMSLGQIATAASLPRSTVQRIVRGLEGQGLAISGRGGVKLGPAITRLAASAHIDVVSAATRFVEAAGRRTRETVDLSVHRGVHALSVYQIASDQELRVVSQVGAAYPLHCTAHGKALLAELTDQEVIALLDGSLDACTAQSKTLLPDLLKDLAQVRQDGLAIDREEHARGVCGIGVAIRSGGPDRYAVSIAVPSLRFDESFAELKAALLKCRAEIEQAVGI